MAVNRRHRQRLKDREKLGWKAKKPGRKARYRDVLTDAYVAALTTKAFEYAVHDIEYPSFGVRVRTTGSKTYFLRPQKRGTKKIIFLGRSEKILATEAREKARSIERRLANGGSIADFSSPSTTRRVEDAFKVYIAGWSGTPTWRRKIECTFEQDILPALGDRPLADLRAVDFEAAIGNYCSSYGRRQRRYIASAFLTWCTKTGRLHVNVLKGLPASPKPLRLRNPIELDTYELGLIWDACNLLPIKWAQAIRLMIVLAEPIDYVLKLEADGRSDPEGPVHKNLRAPSFSREYFVHIAQGCEGLLFPGRDKQSSMQFQSRMIERLRAEFYWLGRFSAGDIMQASLKYFTALRASNTEWNELHPLAVRFKDAARSADDEVEI